MDVKVVCSYLDIEYLNFLQLNWNFLVQWLETDYKVAEAVLQRFAYHFHFMTRGIRFAHVYTHRDLPRHTDSWDVHTHTHTHTHTHAAYNALPRMFNTLHTLHFYNVANLRCKHILQAAN